MDDGADISNKTIVELVTSVKQLIKRTGEIPRNLVAIEERVEAKLDRIVHLLKVLEDDTKTHKRMLYGDGEDHRGVIGRQNALEDKFKLVWAAIGIFGSAVIIGVANLALGYFRK